MIKNIKNIVIKVSFISTMSVTFQIAYESYVCQSDFGNAACQFAIDRAVCQPPSDSATVSVYH
jgi:hypothetical protein